MAESLDHVFKVLMIGDAGKYASRINATYLFYNQTCTSSSSILLIVLAIDVFGMYRINQVVTYSLTVITNALSSPLLLLLLLPLPLRIPGVGKSSILQQFTDGYFSENLQSTIGVDFKVKVMTVLGPDDKPKRIKVTIWDTAGQERFRTLTSSYYRGAQGIIMVYDVSRKDTFESLNMWLQEIEQFSMNGGKDVVKLLVGNKIDQQRVVDRGTANAWARNKGMLFMEASAKTKEGISQVFNEVVQKVLENPNLIANTRPAKPKGTNLNTNNSNKGGASCC